MYVYIMFVWVYSPPHNCLITTSFMYSTPEQVS